ncbi:DegT/DnrJ/EryC1/StrS aminotransferase family protein [Candidatus Pelagibacter sp.]|nr:DegT/DnrJ/EryC1/StrS aminotransferase family protein [Candidatus Pelagibacter sp.]
MIKVPFGRPDITSQEIKAVVKVLKNPILAHGPLSHQFEKLFAKFTGSKFATTVSSCTAGMHLFYLANDIKSGDEVIVTSQSHISTAHSISLTGAKPVFIDCNSLNGTIDTKLIEKKITKKTKAISLVHHLGNPSDMKEIVKIAKKNNLLVLEDCATALGARINNKHVGNFGNAGVFSFYPIKHITTAEGGIIISNNKKIINKINMLKAFGVNKSYLKRRVPGEYDANLLGLNYRMNEISAAIGIEQIKRFPNFLKIRKKNYNYLLSKIIKKKSFNIIKFENKPFYGSYYCLCIVINDERINRLNIINRFNNKGVGTSIYYPKPIPEMSYYKKKYGYKSSKFINAEKFSYRTIALPLGTHLKKKDLNLIADSINSIL